jgi:hypothetical protein
MKSKRRIHQVVIGRMKNNNNKKKGFLFFVGVLIVMDLENLWGAKLGTSTSAAARRCCLPPECKWAF